MIRGAAHKVAHLNIVEGVQYVSKRLPPADAWDGNLESLCRGCVAAKKPTLCNELNARMPHKGKCASAPVSQGSIVWVVKS